MMIRQLDSVPDGRPSEAVVLRLPDSCVISIFGIVSYTVIR